MEILGTFMTQAVTGAGAAAGASAATLTGLQTAGTVFSALTGFAAANSKSQQLKIQAKEAEMAATDEYIAGAERQRALYQELSQSVGNQAVAFAAGGVSLNSQSVKVNRARTIEDGERAIETSRNNTTRAVLARKRQARNARTAAKNVFAGQLVNTVTSGLDLAGSISKRGSISSQAPINLIGG